MNCATFLTLLPSLSVFFFFPEIPHNQDRRFSSHGDTLDTSSFSSTREEYKYRETHGYMATLQTFDLPSFRWAPNKSNIFRHFLWRVSTANSLQAPSMLVAGVGLDLLQCWKVHRIHSAADIGPLTSTDEHQHSPHRLVDNWVQQNSLSFSLTSLESGNVCQWGGKNIQDIWIIEYKIFFT